MPQPSKGDRVVVTARIPGDYFKKLDQYVKATNVSKTDFINDLVTTALDDIDVENINPQQERLKMSA